MAGVIPREKVIGFERLLWFACRGNVFLRHEPIYQALEDPVSVSESECQVLVETLAAADVEVEPDTSYCNMMSLKYLVSNFW